LIETTNMFNAAEKKSVERRDDSRRWTPAGEEIERMHVALPRFFGLVSLV
jgi:hypothetical protein